MQGLGQHIRQHLIIYKAKKQRTYDNNSAHKTKKRRTILSHDLFSDETLIWGNFWKKRREMGRMCVVCS